MQKSQHFTKATLNCFSAVIITDQQTTPSAFRLREGEPVNEVNMATVVSTSREGGTVTGDQLWRLGFYGSTNPDGSGQRVGYQEQILPYYHADHDLRSPGDTLDFSGLNANFDMTGISCSETRYLCTVLSKNPRASDDFTLTTQPNDDVLTSCFPVPSQACTGEIMSCNTNCISSYSL